jgi:prophage regulatory protein
MSDSIIRLPEVEKRTGFKRTAIYQKAKAGQFPKPVKLGERSSGWLASEIEAWIQARVQDRDMPTGGNHVR